MIWIFKQEEYTALHLASENGWLDIVEYLIDDCGMTATNRKNVVSRVKLFFQMF